MTKVTRAHWYVFYLLCTLHVNKEEDKAKQQAQTANNNVACTKERVLSTNPRGGRKNESLRTTEAHNGII